MATACAAPPEPLSRPARFTADEFLRMAELGAFGDRKVELAGGEIVEVPLPGWMHAELQAVLIQLLATAIAPAHQVLGEVTIRLNASHVRDLDAAVVYRRDRKPGPVDPGTVVLAVEIADSTLPTDLHVKAAEYAQAGIPHYWVVDPQAELVYAMSEPGASGYEKRPVIRFGEPLAVPEAGTEISIPVDC